MHINDSALVKITEVYSSIQGESSYAGFPCTFIRLTGCPLRCRWCDTVYGFEGGENIPIYELISRVQSYGLNLIEVTGGEPLAQENTIKLLSSLVRHQFRVLLETGGSEPIENVPNEIHIIMDLKCPDSGMSDRNHIANLQFLKPTDEIKFVIASRKDYEWAKTQINDHKISSSQALFSPAFGLIKPSELSSWMVKDQVKARLNMQLHKYIWSPKAKGV